MGGTPKDLEALWRHNKELRKKAIAGKLSPPEFQRLPPQLRLPVKLRGWGRPRKGLRGPALVEWLMCQGGLWRDRRFDDCINAMLEHGLIVPGTHEFSDRQGPEVDWSNEDMRTRCLAEFRARYERLRSQRRASLEIAAEWALGKSLEAGAKGLRDQLRPK